jgi:hypothetical protein
LPTAGDVLALSANNFNGSFNSDYRSKKGKPRAVQTADAGRTPAVNSGDFDVSSFDSAQVV